MSVWASLEGQVVNGVLPLLRCVASSDRSAVFRTESSEHVAYAVALKLIRIDPASAQSELARWRATAGLSHPHLIRIFEVGECQLGELQCAYLLMEYADQSLAQLLERRALSEQEASETLLAPTLDALGYLHERKLTLGKLKPSSILAVGNQLKLASDAVRRADEAADALNSQSAYDAPEVRDGVCSAASDIWALGVTVCEALTLRLPSGLHDGGDAVELPSDLPAPFRTIVARCVRKRPEDRADVAELQSLLHSEHEADAAAKPAPETTLRLVIRAPIIPQDRPLPSERRHLISPALAVAIGASAVLALSWMGIRAFKPDATSASAVRDQESAVESPTESPTPPLPPPQTVPPANGNQPAAASTPRTARSNSTPIEPAPSPVKPDERRADAKLTALPPSVHEELPNAAPSALQTIRGTIRVSIHVTIDKNGTVIAATTQEAGPSRYFERLALAAAKKWTFAPIETDEEREARLRFSYTRAGVTARAESSP